MIFPYVLLFLLSAVLLFYSSSQVVSILMKMARFLGLREFVLGFFIMAFAASLPNLFLGINSALQKIPQLSFGDVIGGNVVDLTLVVALATLFSKKALPAKSRMVQKSAIFCAFIAVLPLLLVFDGTLSRKDGVILIASFFVYAFWLFSKHERFQKEYEDITRKERLSFTPPKFFIGVLKLIFFLAVLFFATEGVVVSIKNISSAINIGLPLIGILVVGLANCLPETYFSIISARKGQNWMILGDLMGSVVVCATLVLGIVALIQPIETDSLSPFMVARLFLVISAVFFYIIVKTGQKISKEEAIFLLIVYGLFLFSELNLIDFSRFLL